jgi:DeoR/GlpR family transcriptional regulator of sugar metabolism
MLAPERRNQILNLVIQKKSVLVKDLSVMFDVTGETIRKDLAILEKEGKILKTYGGAYVCDGVQNEIPITLRESLYTDEKKAIGAVCASLVQNGDTVSLDGSTTCLHIAKNLTEHTDVTVLTNSLRIAEVFSECPKIRLILSGGELNQEIQCFVNHRSEELLASYFVDKCFVSCRGIHMQTGITDGSESNGRIRRIMLDHAKQRYLVVDSTKIDLTNFYQIGTFDLVNTMVIDRLDSSKWKEFIFQKGIRLIEAGKEAGNG